MSRTSKSINKKELSENVTLDERGKIKVSASPTSSKHDFDFLQGSFQVHHKRLKSWLSNSNEWFEFDGSMENQTILMGIGNAENHYMTRADGSPVEGFALRLFDPQTQLWSIYWADSQSGILDIPVVGSFEGSKGYFFANDNFNGQEILLQFEWDITNVSQPVWRQAFSVDQGNTWEWNWYMYFSKSDQDVYQIQPEFKKLEPLVGVWETKGWMRESSSAPAAEIIATDTYEWLVNGFVLLHRVDARVGNEKVDGAEIIGYHPSQPAYQTQYFGSDGPNAYEAQMIEEAGGLVWKMQSKKDRFTGVFSENRDIINGHWERLDNEGRWYPWMDITLTKVKN